MNNKDNKPLTAYFCMEYGLDESFKIYSGGLGILAGDILKAAHDLNMPMVGIGILWRQGYDRQVIAENGKPMDCFPEYSYDFLKDTGVMVEVTIRNRPVKIKAVSYTHLYLHLRQMQKLFVLHQEWQVHLKVILQLYL